jgi:hypothetical protein
MLCLNFQPKLHLVGLLLLFIPRFDDDLKLFKTFSSGKFTAYSWHSQPSLSARPLASCTDQVAGTRVSSHWHSQQSLSARPLAQCTDQFATSSSFSAHMRKQIQSMMLRSMLVPRN